LNKFLQAVPIAFNNFLLRVLKRKIPAREILILLPRCMQHNTCTQDVVASIENCKKCGTCPTGDVATLAEKYDIPAGLATGSLIARELVKQYKPRLIIAVACERELVQGMFSVFPRPVYALNNSRPNGPCKNTQIDIASVETIIKRFKVT